MTPLFGPICDVSARKSVEAHTIMYRWTAEFSDLANFAINCSWHFVRIDVATCAGKVHKHIIYIYIHICHSCVLTNVHMFMCGGAFWFTRNTWIYIYVWRKQAKCIRVVHVCDLLAEKTPSNAGLMRTVLSWLLVVCEHNYWFTLCNIFY